MTNDKILFSSINKKVIMAVTGLMLVGFVIAHMLGNLQIFFGAEQLNNYAAHIKGLPTLLWPSRILLLLTVIVHITSGVLLYIENRSARPVAYRYQDTIQASVASRTMVFSGSILLAFILFHLSHFTLGFTHPQFSHLLDSKGRHDVYSMVVLSFQSIYVSGFYILSMGILCYHLSHGIASLFQSLGFITEKLMPVFRKISIAIALLIFIGNSSIPLAVLLGFLKPVLGGM